MEPIELKDLEVRKLAHKPTKKQLSWIPFIASIFVYFLSRALAEYWKIPLDIYVVIGIIAFLFVYVYNIANKR